jgi:DNA-binding transcriptional LysR family regulator
VSPDFLLSSDGLATGKVDIEFGPAFPVKPPLHSEYVCKEVGALAVKKDHPDVKRRMRRELFNSLNHIYVEIAQGRPGIGPRMADAFWTRQGLRRDVALSVPNFAAAALAAAHTEYIAAVPRRTAEAFSKMLPLKIVEPEFELPRIDSAMFWHARTDADKGARYFRQLVRHTFAKTTS